VDEEAQDNRIRLLLLDTQALFRTGLARLLASEPGLEVAGECGSAAEALEVLGTSPVNIVLLDFDQATDGGDGFMSAARRKGYQGRFLILAGTPDARASAVAIKLGASGVFLKSETPDRLVNAITLVANGALWLDQRIIRLLADQSVDRFPRPADQGSASLLSERERKVLLGILGGLSNRKIADNLGISVGAVKTSVQQLFHKAGVRSRSRLVRAALEGSLVTAADSMRRAQNAAAASLGATPI
jgi:two-component system, NarL family, nitrate/nitrite response regulator NarL